eukprot:TRINITY_DN10636_c0_g1_i1.p1 TRINITY_DN10636_c0_g1~~TRINITY_DN10636_c0_g1_i1.p1  ORF type:complete len:282 (+),score=64.56 TRINITY_DN10636_c0_g1_i1:119-964(+)
MALKRTKVAGMKTGATNAYRLMQFHQLFKSTPLHKRTVSQAYDHKIGLTPSFNMFTPTMNNKGTSEKINSKPYMWKMYTQHAKAFPSFLRTRAQGKWGWNESGVTDAFTPYKTIMEKMFETGEIEGDAGEMWPNQLMQTWFGKRIQHRRTLSWSEQINQRRIHPRVYGWTQEANAKTVYSELLDHQFRPAIEHDALFNMESYGGIDQWVLQNDPMFLTSWEMELVRNVLLVRRMELDKNFVMDKQAEKLADEILDKVRAKYERDKIARQEAGVREAIADAA